MHWSCGEAPAGNGDSEPVFVHIPQAEVWANEQAKDFHLPGPLLSRLSSSLHTFAEVFIITSPYHTPPAREGHSFVQRGNYRRQGMSVS